MKQKIKKYIVVALIVVCIALIAAFFWPRFLHAPTI